MGNPVSILEKSLVSASANLSKSSIKNKEIRANHLGTGIIFSDPQGYLVKEMLDLFDDLFIDADPILEVLPE